MNNEVIKFRGHAFHRPVPWSFRQPSQLWTRPEGETRLPRPPIAMQSLWVAGLQLLPLRALAPLCLALVCMAMATPTSQALRYREQTGTESSTFSWRADPASNGATITVTQYQGDEVFSSVNTREGATLSWRHIKEPDTDIQVERAGDSLRFSGHLAGQPVDRRQAIDGRPWCQPLAFSLQRVAAGEQADFSFWTIRPDTLKVFAMQAHKAGSDRLAGADGNTQAADRVIIRPTGILSALWQAEYWFRSDDHLFLQYRGTHGPPGTDETRILLINP